jgi:hypothetical protein
MMSGRNWCILYDKDCLELNSELVTVEGENYNEKYWVCRLL